MLAIIGGTGLTQLSNLDVSRRQVVRTPYGEASGPLTFGAVRGVPVVFLARHGYGHTIAPHQVNYRANLWALKEQGVGDVVSVVSVGGIRADLGPGRIVVPHQIIDYTCGRMSTFFENEAPVKHIDFRAVDGSLAAGSRRGEKPASQFAGVRLGEIDVLHRGLVLEKRAHPTAGVVG